MRWLHLSQYRRSLCGDRTPVCSASCELRPPMSSDGLLADGPGTKQPTDYVVAWRLPSISVSAVSHQLQLVLSPSSCDMGSCRGRGGASPRIARSRGEGNRLLRSCLRAAPPTGRRHRWSSDESRLEASMALFGVVQRQWHSVLGLQHR